MAGDPLTPAELSTVEIRASAGPPMWKYVRGDKTVWVVGDLGVVRKGTKFHGDAISRRVAESGAVLGRQGLVVGDNVGLFRAMTLYPAIRKVRFNAGDARLQDVLPADVLAHWIEVKMRYGRSDDLDRQRPMYAAFELYQAGLDAHGLSVEDDLQSLLRVAAKAHRVPVIDAHARLPIDDARKTVRSFDVPRDADIGCLSETMTRVDAWWPAAQALSDAWIAGDVAAARAARSVPPVRACWSTLTNGAIARSQGIDDLDGLVRYAWREGLRKAVREHAVVLATIPLGDALDGNGLARILADEGFQPEPTLED
ncbi:TraB/GumN family protein [Noviluteimonas dokdonensis]|nr:TraB/GumN family protein [Lysobacter dokdonensis]